MDTVLLMVGVVAIAAGIWGILFFCFCLLVQRLRKKPLESVVKGLRISGTLVVVGVIAVIIVGIVDIVGGDDEPQESNPPQVSEAIQESESPQESEPPQVSEMIPETEPPVETEKADDEPVISEDEIWAMLLADADSHAIGCAETLIRNTLKDPASAIFYNEEILDRDDYLRYVVKLTVSATNSFGGRVEDTYICNFRIKSEDTSRFIYNQYLGIQEYSIYSEEYRPEDWWTEPDDFTLAPAQLTPESVSLKTLLANAADYDGKYVVITDDLRVMHNDLENREYKAYLSTGRKSWDYDNSFELYINYSYMDNADEWAQLSAKDHPVIRVEGVFRLYSNKNNTGYLEARKLEKK